MTHCWAVSGLIHDQRYRTDTDAECRCRNADAELRKLTASKMPIQDKYFTDIFINAGMSDYLASGLSGTVMNKNADAGINSVPGLGDPIRYRCASVPD